jgi:hypothetical protein
MPPIQRQHGQPQPAEQADREPEPPGAGLLARLAQVPDPRSRRGRRYPLPALLGIAVAAVLSGAKTYTEVAEFAAELSQTQLAALGVPKRVWEARYQTPKETALRRLLLQRLDAQVLDEVVGGWPSSSQPARMPRWRWTARPCVNRHGFAAASL